LSVEISSMTGSREEVTSTRDVGSKNYGD